jgi:type I restriction-modification system DNA methylase subunit
MKDGFKDEVARLVEKYDKVASAKQIKSYNEEMTKKDFILPLFRTLGWDIENSAEVSAEEKVSRKKVDYGFRINGVPKFYLEAKPLKGDLDNPKYVEQAIGYAWHKGCTWAVLTNFTSIKIFNAEWKTANVLQSNLKTIFAHEFGDRLNELWLLSRESFETGLLDKEAEKWGKKTTRVPIDKQLLADFTRFRELLSKNIAKLNQGKGLNQDDLDEAVQRILDRLIFIRNCEDRELEPKSLISNLRELESSGQGNHYKSLREVFAHFDKHYNSKIFAEHLADALTIDDATMMEIIEGLYYSENQADTYDFSAIEADVLGNIYEQYLSHILRKTQKRAKIKQSQAHKKEQGIFYTPTYVVEFIVRNTVGSFLSDHPKVKTPTVRILDPACGSGSFLIKAFDLLSRHSRKKDKSYDQTQLDFAASGTPYSKKLDLLQGSIFGVDLDKQAVEIAQLNLLLKVSEKGHRLPLLEGNIRGGNSIVDDSAVAGRKAFLWKEQFSKIMEDGGFDVVIGNPPYIPIENFTEEEKEYYAREYKSPFRKFDSSILFIERSIELLRDGGYLGMIVPLTWQTGDNYLRFREFIFSGCDLSVVVNLPFDVFQDAYVDTGIVILQKGKKKNSKYRAFSYDKKDRIQRIDGMKYDLIEQKLVENEPDKKVFTNRSTYKMMEKLKKNTIPFGSITDSCQGVVVSKFKISDQKISEYYKELLTKGTGDRYSFRIEETRYINYTEAIGLYKFYSQPRMFIRRIVNRQNRLMAFNYEKPLITKKDYNPFIFLDKSYDPLYLLGLMNSRLFSFMYIHSSALALKDDFRQTTLAEIRRLPVRKASKTEQSLIVAEVNEIISLKNRLGEFGDKKTDERAAIEGEIGRVDREIDNAVYRLYGLSKEEIEIVESAM